MRKIENGTIYSFSDFPYDDFKKIDFDGRGKKRAMKLACAFDIETSKYIDKYNEHKEAGQIVRVPHYNAFMWRWQFAVATPEGIPAVVFGDTWEEYESFISAFTESYPHRIVVYVHNLAHEFQFLRSIFPDHEAFFTEARKPLYFTTHGGKVEYRCSYRLSNKSLAAWCNDYPGIAHKKALGDLDYSVLRYPGHICTSEEDGYCYNDVAGLVEILQRVIWGDGYTLADIPYTSTGYVRADFKAAAASVDPWKNLFNKMRPTPAELRAVNLSMRGGYTQASVRYMHDGWYADQDGVVRGDIRCRDFCSSYPAVILTWGFPMGHSTKRKPRSEKELFSIISEKCVLARCAFKNIRLSEAGKRINFPYISYARCEHVIKRGAMFDQGKIRSCEGLVGWFNDDDLILIRKYYDWDKMYIDDCYQYKRGKLPGWVFDTTFEYFKKKNELKVTHSEESTLPVEEVERLEYLCMKSKNKLNAIAGMMETNIVHHVVEEPENIENDWIDVMNTEEEAIEAHYKRFGSAFLPPQWGAWVLSHGRRALFEYGLEIAGKDAIYCDTDSVYYNSTPESEKRFEENNKKLRQIAIDAGCVATKRDGKKSYPGEFTPDGEYTAMKILGCKKYMLQKTDGSYKVTIAGVSKKKALKALTATGDPFKNFHNGFSIVDSGHTAANYNDVSRETLTLHGHTFTTGSNVAIVDKPYMIGQTDELLQLIGIIIDEVG